MRPEDILNNAIASIKSGIDTVENKYVITNKDEIKEVKVRKEKQKLLDDDLPKIVEEFIKFKNRF